MQKKILFFSLFTIAPFLAFSQNPHTLKGQITNENNDALPYAHIYIEELNQNFGADINGKFEIGNINSGDYTLAVSYLGYQAEKKTLHVEDETDEIAVVLSTKDRKLNEVQVFGVQSKTPEKLDVLTRMPLSLKDQIQSISVISDRVIHEQGNLTISDVTRNVPGVYTFATYGNQRESMSMRGFRGVPILKNGVRVNSDFRGTGVLTDMQGVESMQVLKGAAAITQGVATDIGSPGGVINIVTKTPKFVNSGSASLRVGSWNQVRPAFDIQNVLNESGTIAFRLNGAYEHANSYRPGISFEKLYINPSLAWKPTEKTTIVLEMDYLNDTRTPDPGTINLAANDSNAIYQLPYDLFPGFSSNRVVTKATTYAARFVHELNEHLYVRAGYFGSLLNNEGVTTSFSSGSGKSGQLPALAYNERYRSIGGSTRMDNNSVLQIDLVGKDIETGFLKHTFMVGADYRNNSLETGNSKMGGLNYVDIIDFTGTFGSRLPQTGKLFVPAVKDAAGNITEPAHSIDAPIELKENPKVTSNQSAFGILAQDMITITDWAKVVLGMRFSSQISHSSASEATYSTGSAFDPQLGLVVSPTKNINLFGSYTTSSSLRGADNLDTLGNELGNQKISQIEAGIKSEWLNGKLRFNLTVYKINNRNMSLVLYDANWNPTGFYTKGGNDERKGLEVEVLGRLSKNFELIAGYAYIDAQYKEHNAYFEGSAPLNTPKHTANGWARYQFDQGILNGLSLGLGAYYISARPVNDWAKTVTHEGIIPGQKPFNIDAVTTVNAQIGYQYKNFQIQVLANNLMNKIGYNAYRTSYINQTDPRNFAAVLSYRF